MKFRRVFRGCFTSYVVGVLLFFVPFANAVQASGFGDLVSSFIWVSFVGAIVALSLSAIVALIWAVLAGLRLRVHFLWAFFFAGLAASSIYGFGLTSMIVGVIFGASFWLGAFGLRPSVIVASHETRGQDSAESEILTDD